ncbi:MAG: hypothetical protein ABS46_15565 [Cytophagaceae bacterium SCN 52-12]|nr:MAG: hypothetical protein ABS46_15565 [Cytophagaceae bacterium SCN 52-12]
MPDRKHIKSFLCCLVAAMLLAASMGSGGLPPEYSREAPALEKSESKSSPAGQENQGGQTVVRALSLDAVVISLFSFHLSQYILPALQPAVRLSGRSGHCLPARFSEPVFFFCYFHKVFGKQIAANAP